MMSCGGETDSETEFQNFRQFSYQKAEGPRVNCSQLWALCHGWLKPERHTKEQIVELVVLEQFLMVLPPEMGQWVRKGRPKSCFQAVVLAEEYLLKQQLQEKTLDVQVSMWPPGTSKGVSSCVHGKYRKCFWND
uniref:SCAN box domain-containing protein n=1 Tax=Salvator merianae TaxID=96440 RepID=A0A8D0E2H7_SALMN